MLYSLEIHGMKIAHKRQPPKNKTIIEETDDFSRWIFLRHIDRKRTAAINLNLFATRFVTTKGNIVIGNILMGNMLAHHSLFRLTIWILFHHH